MRARTKKVLPFSNNFAPKITYFCFVFVRFLVINIKHFFVKTYMEYPSKIVEEAVGQFAKLPGIGKKTALRLVLHLLKQDEENAKHFSESILKLKSDLHYCKQCNNISDHDLCNICAD